VEVPNTLATPIATFANSPERRIAQVVRCPREVKRIPLQYSPAPAVEPHLLDCNALTLRCPLARIGKEFLESTSTKECVRSPKFSDAESETAIRSGRSLR
jgi:hypothetical protein